MEKVLKDIYIVEKKWSLIWLNDKEKQTIQTLDYFDFKALLYQSFTEEQIKKILEELDCEKKLLIDFNKEKVKIINQKEEPFINQMKLYMNPNFIQDSIDNPEENIGTFINF